MPRREFDEVDFWGTVLGIVFLVGFAVVIILAPA